MAYSVFRIISFSVPKLRNIENTLGTNLSQVSKSTTLQVRNGLAHSVVRCALTRENFRWRYAWLYNCAGGRHAQDARVSGRCEQNNGFSL